MEHGRVRFPGIYCLLGVILLGGLAGCRTGREELSPVMRLLPEREIPELGLVAEGQPAEYPGKRLQEYVFDGVYVPMSFGFRTLAAARYRDTLDTRNTVLVEVYELQTPLDAVALLRFAHRNIEPGSASVPSRRDANTFAFAKGRYYVVMRSVLMASERWDRVADLASSLARRIADDETGLDRLKKLPAEAVREPVFFVRTERLLEELVTLPPGGGFGFHTADTVALVADRADAAGRLALIEYPDAGTARAAAELVRGAIGKAWSRWIVTHSGRYALMFVRHTGRCDHLDVARTEELARRIAQDHP